MRSNAPILSCVVALAALSLFTTTAVAQTGRPPKMQPSGGPPGDAGGFNVLESIVLDPATGEVELIGRRDPGSPPAIPYRQVLDEAVTFPGPQFSLDSDFSRFTRSFISGKSLDELMFSGDDLTQFGRVTLAALEIPQTETTRKGFISAVLRQSGFSLAADLRDAVRADEGGRVDTSATVGQWISILGLVADYETFQQNTGGNATSNPEAADVFYLKILRGLAGSFEGEGTNVASLYRQLRNSGTAPDPALLRSIQDFLDSYEELLVRSIDILLERHDMAAINYDSRELGVAFGAFPVSRPSFTNLGNDTQLGRLLLEGDSALKSVPFDAALRRVEGYETFPDWAREYIGREDLDRERETRYWITVDSVEVRESSDGNIAAIAQVQMRVESRSKGIDEPWSAERIDPITQEYADLLTDHFDELAARVPALYNLREAAKVITLANWLRDKGVRPAPAEKPVYWSPPTEVSGFLAMMPYLRGGRVLWGIWPSGGVDFDFGSRIRVRRDPELTEDAVRSSVPKPDPREEQRRRLLGRVQPGSPLSIFGQMDRMRVETFIREVARTWELSEELPRVADGVAALNRFLLETQRLQARDLKTGGASYVDATRYLSGLNDDLRTLGQADQEAVEAVTRDATDVERLSAAATAVPELVGPLTPDAYISFQPTRVGELQAVADDATIRQLRDGLTAWEEALEQLNVESPDVFERMRQRSTNLLAFIQATGRGSASFHVYDERTQTLRELLPHLGQASETAGALDGILDRQFATLEEERREIEAPRS